MQGLMYRLAELDADSVGLVRVIDYFDALVRHGADIAAMVRASAVLADCTVGISVPGWLGAGDDARRCDQRGRWNPQPPHSTSSAKPVVIDDVVIGSVWIERSGASLPLDEMLVDRMALTAAIILHPVRLSTPAEHTRNLLFPMDAMAVLTSCAALRLEPTAPVRVLIGAAGHATPSLPTAGTSVEISVDDETLTVIDAMTVPTGGDKRRGISLVSPVSGVHMFVSSARFALRQTSVAKPIVDAADLGALNLLAPGSRVPHSSIPDLVNAMELGNSIAGSELLETLRVYLDSGTLRGAADRLHLHHSSVAHRLTKLSHCVGFAVDATENRARATAMLMALNSA